MKNLDFNDKFVIKDALNERIKFYKARLAQFDVNHPLYRFAQNHIDECLCVLEKLND